jgi:non-ribosomal peptide synthetase component E (peptide arylation enzyme)
MGVRLLTKRRANSLCEEGVWQRRLLYEVVEQWADRQPDAVAIVDQHDAVSYREFVRRTNVVASALLDLDLAPGTAVALQTPNRNVISVFHLACDRADLTFVPLSTEWRATEVEHLLSVASAAVVVVPPPLRGFDYLGMINTIRGRLPSLRTVATTEAGGADFDIADLVTATQPEAPSVNRLHDANDPRYVMVTSGTTGLPKMSLWTDNDLWFFLSEYREAAEFRRGDVAVGIAPASSGATGYVFPGLAPLLFGGTSVLLERWDAAAALELTESTRATHLTGVPTQLLKLLQDPSVEGRDYSALRVVTNAGSVMPPDAAMQVESTFGCVCQSIYGATDGGVPTMVRVSDPPEKRYTTVGRPLRHTELRLTGPDGAVVAEGEPGEICWRNPTKTFGYFNDPTHTDEAFVGNGWYRSGDLGRIDADGYLTVVGRAKDLIIRGGQNISPREIEDALYKHPAVAEVSVIGVPDPLYGERACACIVTRPGQAFTHEEMTAFLEARQLARFKLPELLEAFDDLPISAGGKVMKDRLVQMVVARMGKA